MSDPIAIHPSSMRRAVLLIGIAGGVLLGALLWLSKPQTVVEPPTPAPATDKVARVKVDVNQASREELLGLPGMSPELATKIIQHRPYRKLDDLVSQKVLGKKEFARIREYIVVRRGS